MENHIQLHSTHLVLNVLPFELFPELLNNEINRKCLEEGAYSYFKTRYDTLKKNLASDSKQLQSPSRESLRDRCKFLRLSGEVRLTRGEREGRDRWKCEKITLWSFE